MNNRIEAPMASQLTLQLAPDVPTGARPINNDKIHVGSSTFLNGLADRVHRWFRLTPSFGPDLVHEMLEKLNVSQNEVVLDPFAGAGTTLIECKLEGRISYGIEINPLLHFVNEVSLNWEVSPEALENEIERLNDEFESHPRVEVERLQDIGLSIPPIHNPHRWWRSDVLVDLLILRKAIDATVDDGVRQLLRLVLAGVLVPDLTNVTLGKLQLHFIDRSSHRIEVWPTYAAHARRVAEDLRALRATPSDAEAICFHHNSTEMDSLQLPRKVDAVITSPPYPNRYSYVWNTRPHLYMLGMVEDRKEPTEIDRKTIGGTWGTATSELKDGQFAPLNAAVEEVVEPICRQIRERDNLMANYVMHYFNRLTQQIVAMDGALSDRARLAYVVGNSWIKDVYVETDVMLGDILDRLELGWETLELHRFRKRHSGKELYETIVYAAK